ncbi:MAG TPA: ABC transporter permease, partial [Thermoanaerobaculia bacterium]
MNPLIRDVRYALRTLARAPAFTIAAVLALCLAIGANTAVFSVINALLSFPIPFAEPERAAFLMGENPEQGIVQGGVSADDFLDLHAELRSFSDLAAVADRFYNVVGAGEPVRVRGAQVTPGFFDVTGITLARGRPFLDEEGAPGGARVAIVSFSFWQQSLGADPEVLGRTLDLDGEVHAVVGVTPEGFFFPQPTTQIWTPLALAGGAAGRDQRRLLAVGRLAGEATSRQATAEARAVAERLAAEYPDTNRGWTAIVQTIPENLRQGSSLVTILLYSAITFVLLIACVNVANLILARSLGRERELALRSSFGASRRRLVRQLLTESLVLALAGGGAGFLTGLWGIRVLRNWLAPDPNIGFIATAIQPEAQVVLHAVTVTTLAGILFGLMPAFKATRGDLATVLKEGGRGGESRERRRLRGALVMAEVALALALLVTAGTLIRAFKSIYAADPGLDPSNLLTLELALPEHSYP